MTEVRPVRVLVVDDEPIARQGLRDMLARFEWMECVGEAGSGPAAVSMIDALAPEVVFLDIQMPGFSGIDVLQRVSHQPFVIFTTAFVQHAVTAFELGAIDYLLKPFGPERLAATIERVRSAVGEPAGAPTLDRLRDALATGPMSRLFVRTGAAIVPIPVNAVSWFEAWGDYVVAHVGKAQHVLHLSLNHLEQRLDRVRFTRIHRTHIVNLDVVTAFKRHGKGRLVAHLSDGTQLPVSRARSRDLRDVSA